MHLFIVDVQQTVSASLYLLNKRFTQISNDINYFFGCFLQHGESKHFAVYKDEEQGMK